MSKTLFIIGSLVVALAVSVFLVWPTYQDLQEIEFKVEEKRAELRNQENYHSALEEAESKLDQHPDQLEKVNSALPSQPDLPSMFNFFQDIADEKGHLYLWVTHSHLREGLNLMRSWGFDYKTVIVWDKMTCD